jgi:bacterioferritin-associated ferredoxin
LGSILKRILSAREKLMSPAFVFAEDIAKALREGKREITVAEDARISSAALDLIREKDVRIVRKAGQDANPGKMPPAVDVHEKEAQPESVIRDTPDGGASPLTRDGSLSEEDVEIIVNRVIERFRELKGGKPPKPEETTTAQEDGDDLVICRCEEITKGEIKEAIRNGMRTLNGIKRVTRAGMGLCQGQTCQRLVSQILAGELGRPPGEFDPTTARAPVRPVKLSVLATG